MGNLPVYSTSITAGKRQVRHTLLSELETGKKADTTGAVLTRLAQALGVSIDYLVGRYRSEQGTEDLTIRSREHGRGYASWRS